MAITNRNDNKPVALDDLPACSRGMHDAANNDDAVHNLDRAFYGQGNRDFMSDATSFMDEAMAHSTKAVSYTTGMDNDSGSYEAYYRTKRAVQQPTAGSISIAAEMHDMAERMHRVLSEPNGDTYEQSSTAHLHEQIADAHAAAAAALRNSPYYPGGMLELDKVGPDSKILHDSISYDEDGLFSASGDRAGYGHRQFGGGPLRNAQDDDDDDDLDLDDYDDDEEQSNDMTKNMVINTIDDPSAILPPTLGVVANYNPSQPRDKRGRWQEGHRVHTDIKGQPYSLTKLVDGWRAVPLESKTDRLHRNYVISTDHSGLARSCSCADFKYRGGPCKHMAAVNRIEAESDIPPTAVGNALPLPQVIVTNTSRYEPQYATVQDEIQAQDDAALVPPSCVSHLSRR